MQQLADVDIDSGAARASHQSLLRQVVPLARDQAMQQRLQGSDLPCVLLFVQQTAHVVLCSLKAASSRRRRSLHAMALDLDQRLKQQDYYDLMLELEQPGFAVSGLPALCGCYICIWR